MTLLVSVVVPTYNGESVIGIPLQALALQDAPPGSFEVLVIDNASTDRTAETVAMHPAVRTLGQRNIRCRVIREERQGATFARIRGVREAASEIVCFLDDDTAPDPDYIREAVTAFSAPEVGLVVAAIHPDFETDPPPSIARRDHLLAVNDELGDDVVDFGAHATIAPTNGAGMSVRKSVFLSAIPWQNPELLLADRVGNSLGGCGDIEFGYLIGKAGYKRIYSPRLRLFHFIPERRLRMSYICRLIMGGIRSEITLRARCEGQRYTPGRRALALAKLIFAAVASPVLFLRKDGSREVVFVLVSRWAQLKGPFASALPHSSAPVGET